VSRGRPFPPAGGAVLLLVLPCLLPLEACARPVDGVPAAAPVSTRSPSADELGELIVTEVPSGLPRLPDEDLTPPAGAKRVEDIAGYSEDPARERAVLADHGYRHGWERFWGTPTGPVTGVLVDRFESRAGAGAYAEEVARNEAELYRGMLSEDPAGLPGGCWLLTVEDPDPAQLHGPAAFAWCVHGVFSVSATAVTDSVDAAEEEVRAVLTAQLELLPPR
jgi:hypothetical protein